VAEQSRQISMRSAYDKSLLLQAGKGARIRAGRKVGVSIGLGTKEFNYVRHPNSRYTRETMGLTARLSTIAAPAPARITAVSPYEDLTVRAFETYSR